MSNGLLLSESEASLTVAFCDPGLHLERLARHACFGLCTHGLLSDFLGLFVGSKCPGTCYKQPKSLLLGLMKNIGHCQEHRKHILRPFYFQDFLTNFVVTLYFHSEFGDF